MRARLALVLVLVAGAARAERYRVERGETLEAVAASHGCTTRELLRANHLDTTLVPPGTIVQIPRCGVRSHARTRPPRSDVDKARAALAVIDGATWTAPADDDPPAAVPPAPHRRASASLGVPWRGRLVDGERLPRGAGYLIRRPTRAYGASYVIEHLRGAIAEVRALYPDVPTLAIGDLSAAHGGPLASHLSHQSGLDVDVGFYFKRVPRGYPAHFAPANADLDDEATWALLAAFARTADLRDGVQIIFLDYDVQRRLYDYAKAHGTPDDELRFLFQYPRGKHAMVGLVRHWPGHTDHFHVRFKDAR